MCQSRSFADLPGLGGLQVLLDVLRNPASTGAHVGALHALGTAASNHPDFQQQAIDTPHLVASLCEVNRHAFLTAKFSCQRSGTIL